MNTDKEWEARARELGFGDDALRPYELELAIKFGREMAEERAKDLGARLDSVMAQNERMLTVTLPMAKAEAADERAEEIARVLDAVGGNLGQVARSTIQKPNEPSCSTCGATTRDDPRGQVCSNGFHGPLNEAAIRADEREKIAALVGRKAPTSIKKIVNLIRGGEPKTREQVLEEALRKIRDDHDMDHLAESSPHHNCVLCRVKDAARRALEWKP